MSEWASGSECTERGRNCGAVAVAVRAELLVMCTNPVDLERSLRDDLLHLVDGLDENIADTQETEATRSDHERGAFDRRGALWLCTARVAVVTHGIRSQHYIRQSHQQSSRVGVSEWPSAFVRHSGSVCAARLSVLNRPSCRFLVMSAIC